MNYKEVVLETILDGVDAVQNQVVERLINGEEKYFSPFSRLDAIKQDIAFVTEFLEKKLSDTSSLYAAVAQQLHLKPTGPQGQIFYFYLAAAPHLGFRLGKPTYRAPRMYSGLEGE